MRHPLLASLTLGSLTLGSLTLGSVVFAPVAFGQTIPDPDSRFQARVGLLAGRPSASPLPFRPLAVFEAEAAYRFSDAADVGLRYRAGIDARDVGLTAGYTVETGLAGLRVRPSFGAGYATHRNAWRGFTPEGDLGEPQSIGYGRLEAGVGLTKTFREGSSLAFAPALDVGTAYYAELTGATDRIGYNHRSSYLGVSLATLLRLGEGLFFSITPGWRSEWFDGPVGTSYVQSGPTLGLGLTYKF